MGSTKKRSQEDSSSSSSASSSDSETAPSPIVIKKRKKESNADTGKRRRSSSLEILPPGSVVTCRVEKVQHGEDSRFLMLRYLPWVRLSLGLTEVQDEFADSFPFNQFKDGQFLKCVVLKPIGSQRSDSTLVPVSIRPSLINHNGSLDKLIEEEYERAVEFPEPGALVHGYIERVNKVGAFVRISRGILALVPIRHLADRFVKEVEKEFPVGKLVAGRVLKSEPSKESVVLSLKASTVVGEFDLTINTIKVGDQLEGTVNNVEAYGVFVSLENSRLNGLCHWTELSDDNPSRDLLKGYKPGDNVRVQVVTVDKEKRKLSLSMKPSHFIAQETNSNESSSDSEESDDDVDGLNADRAANEAVNKLVAQDSDSDEEMEEAAPLMQVEESSDDDEDRKETKQLSLKDALKKARENKDKSWNASWKANSEANEESSASESENDSDQEKTTKKRKKSSKIRQRQKRLEEAATVAREQALLRDDKSPQSVDDFERLLLASPNSSLLWIQYMKFQINQTEIDQARAIGERAIETINIRQEEEKQNVWLALWWLEYKFGTESSLETVTGEILQRMDKDVAYMKMADAYIEHDEYDKAEDMLKKALKATKRRDERVWLRLIELCLDRKQENQAQEHFRAMLKSLPDELQTPATTQYIRLQFKKGSAELARTIYERLLVAHPKRNTLWHEIIDIEIKFGENNHETVSELFQRVTSVKMSVKKIKAFFKKWLVYETEHGTEEGREKVKERARSYVESLVNSSG